MIDVVSSGPEEFLSIVGGGRILAKYRKNQRVFSQGDYAARALLLLANFGKEGKPETIIAKVSQETLAATIGTTRARVSFFMNKFRKLGFISYNGKIEVHSSLLSVVLHDQPQIDTAIRKPRKK